jgi:protein SCO1/2
MKKILLLTALLLLILAAATDSRAQVYDSNEPEIGIVEHLGDTIPLNLVFNNEKGNNVTLGDLVNKPTILTLVYFDCPGLCSPLLDGVSDVIEKMDLELGKDYQVLTISFNTQDTPERAVEKKQNFLKKHSLEHAGGWIYLTGDSANIKHIVDAVGFKYKKAGNDWIHAAVITVISPKGMITRYLYGTTFLPFDVKMAIMEAQKGIPRPTINRLLEFCYSYDPSGRRYVLDVTKVSATVIIFLALVLLVTLMIRRKGRKANPITENKQ